MIRRREHMQFTAEAELQSAIDDIAKTHGMTRSDFLNRITWFFLWMYSSQPQETLLRVLKARAAMTEPVSGNGSE